MRGEHRDNKTPLAVADDALERAVHGRLGDRPSGLPDIRAVHEEREYLAMMEHGEFLMLFFGGLAILVGELYVAGEDDIAPRRLDDYSHRVRHCVRDTEEADACAAELDRLVHLDLANVDGRHVCEFLLPFSDHHPCEATGVDYRVADAVGDVGDATNVVEVSV